MEIIYYAQLSIHTDHGSVNAEAWLKEYFGHYFIEVREPYRSYLVSDDNHSNFADASADFRKFAATNRRAGSEVVEVAA